MVSIERFKSRLVAKGYNHVEGLDFFNTFFSNAKITIIRTLLELAYINYWHLNWMNHLNQKVEK